MEVLQVQVEEVTSLAEQLGTWGTIVLLSVFMMYLLIRDWIKKRSEKEKSGEQAVIFQHIANQAILFEDISKYLKIATDQFNDEITKNQANIIIDKFISLMCTKTILYGLEIINRNNVKTQQREIRSKVDLYINNMYENKKNLLSEFKYNKKCLSTLIDYEKSDEISNEVIDIILKGKSGEVLVSYCTNTFQGINIDAKQKLNTY